MLSVTSRISKTQNMYNKENIQAIGNMNDNRKSANKENIKTGVQIKNKLKNKNVFQPCELNKKNAIRKNSLLPEKIQRKMFQVKNLFEKSRKDQCNMSSTSSIKSIKSVTFSIDSSLNNDNNLSQESQRKGSILKNKLSANQHSINCQKRSIASSSHSYLKSIHQAVDNPNSNNIVLLKYQKILKQLKETRQKYTDGIYPPCQQSVFLNSLYTKNFIEKLNFEGYRIKWMRLTELFNEKETCLWHPEKKSRFVKGFIHASGKQSNYMQTVFNCINKSYLMEKFFENQTISQQGIYYVKMHQTQTNNWKYVIVDDFVPVIVSEKKNELGKIIKPAFLNVESEDNIVQLWPFLVQKAFAKYYSTYDSLIKGNTLDFLQEITGEFYQKFIVNIDGQSQQDNQQKINLMIKNPYNIILAETSEGLTYPLKSIGNEIQILDIQNNFRAQKLNRQNFYSNFKKIYIIEVKKYKIHVNSLIKQQNLLEKETQLQENTKPFILRSFTLSESTQCILALTQKQQRFHRNFKTLKNTKNYTYSWMRMLLIQKQNAGYRWIQGGYQCVKSLKLHACLSPGEYFVIILPEWNSKQFNLKLTLFSNCDTIIQRKPYESHERIIEQSCMDLAQRFGKLIQINNNICSYNYIDYKIGFIIQNINNEKTSGEVKILRTIDGLQDFNITPVNADFHQNDRLEIKIPSLQSYTVVLKVSGGVDKSFLQQFDFGV